MSSILSAVFSIYVMLSDILLHFFYTSVNDRLLSAGFSLEILQKIKKIQNKKKVFH